MAMDIFGKILAKVRGYRQARAEREALRLLVERKDRRLLRDVGLDLVEGDAPRCEPMPQTRERRWTAPLIRLPRPSPRERDEAHVRGEREKPAA